MRLREVTIKKSETCLSYALKRLGMWEDVGYIEAEDLAKHFREIPYDEDLLVKGSIILWKDNSLGYLNVTTKILEGSDFRGRFLTAESEVLLGYHVGVIERVEQPCLNEFEKDRVILVSDCTRAVARCHQPSIRVRFLKDCKTPKSILIRVKRYEKKEN